MRQQIGAHHVVETLGSLVGRFLVGAFHQQARKQRKGGIQSRAAAAELLLEKRSVILRAAAWMQGSSGL